MRWNAISGLATGQIRCDLQPIPWTFGDTLSFSLKIVDGRFKSSEGRRHIA